MFIFTFRCSSLRVPSLDTNEMKEAARVSAEIGSVLTQQSALVASGEVLPCYPVVSGREVQAYVTMCVFLSTVAYV